MSQAGKLQRESRQQPTQLSFPGFAPSRDQWQEDYETALPDDRVVKNRSGILVKPLYTHRGRTWTQRQLIGLGTPGDYNLRVLRLLDAGATAISLIPCNSGFRGVDCDDVPLPLLGTCGTVVNTLEDMDAALAGVPLGEISTAMNDPTPFTFLAFLVAVAQQRGVDVRRITGTSNQSDYISHFVANHMFYRLSLEGSRRVLVDHIEFCLDQLPGWNPVSVVGQHMQQAGATPAEAMGLTLSTAIQYAEDCLERGMPPDSFLHRFTFFFDISISMFEEVAKFRAGRRIWARIARDRLGAKDPKSWRFKFHAQTSGLDLTARQPLNNIARVAIQAIAGIMSGLQSMHTDAWDEAFSSPSEDAARIAVSTQNILREEAGLCDVIDPLGGSYYVETMTNEMEEEIVSVMTRIEQAGGMYTAVKSGLVQSMLGRSALKFQEKVESGEQTVVGVNAYQVDEEDLRPSVDRPDPESMKNHVESFQKFKKDRDPAQVQQAINRIRQSANTPEDNIFAHVVDAAAVGVTHGEIVSSLREELGFGRPLIVD
jgi:methylmalonyl-CoA mutase N-terminal domain/subunit